MDGYRSIEAFAVVAHDSRDRRVSRRSCSGSPGLECPDAPLPPRAVLAEPLSTTRRTWLSAGKPLDRNGSLARRLCPLGKRCRAPASRQTSARADEGLPRIGRVM